MELEIIKSSKPALIMTVILLLFLSDIFTKFFQETEMRVLKCLEFQTRKFSPKTYI